MSLRRIRRNQDMTQQQLADIVGVDQTTISDIERGKNRNPSKETVAKIAEALHVTPEQLFPATDQQVVAK